MPEVLTHRAIGFSGLCGETMTGIAAGMLGAPRLVIYDIQHLVLEE
jgi:hypothetical protein